MTRYDSTDPAELEHADPAELPLAEADSAPPEAEAEPYRPLRPRGSDPAFGLVLGFAVSIGLAPLVGTGDPSLRYTLSWGVLAAFGVLAWLLGGLEPVGEERPETLVWGVGFGLLIGVPLMLFGGGTLNATVQRAFGTMTPGELLAYALFVMPIAETLFFRGILHGSRPFWMVGLIATAWSIVLYLPLLDIGNFPLVAAVICVMLVMLNVMYGYVRNRNGLAAAWICQIIANVFVLFLPFVTT
ncbi:MAG: hypothetical protein MUF38_10820 [Anaerolineae bacterium]|jgi:hypothetical protein|nr:hypothetical protein [Anaerolineae bacterium]